MTRARQDNEADGGNLVQVIYFLYHILHVLLSLICHRSRLQPDTVIYTTHEGVE
jgi:hypothetical protein